VVGIQQVVADGLFSSPVMNVIRGSIRCEKKPAFTKLMRSTEAQHRKASDAFERLDGASVPGG